MYRHLLIIVSLLNNVFVSGLNFHSFGDEFEYLAKELNETMATFDSPAIQTNWLEQPLNHFDAHDNRTWKMRYFERHDLWKQDKPVYVYLGGEGPAKPIFLKTGIMYDLAQETSGALFMCEHRYYGKSKPFEDFTPANLEFLSSRQALADFARVLTTIKSSPKFEKSKVVVVGGSYAGNLAAWMKLLYPNLVDAAIASSAPVLAKIDFYEYLETVSENFEQYGSPGCWNKIANTFADYEKAFETDEGVKSLKTQENICDSCDMMKPRNKQLYFLEKASQFMYISQYGNPRAVKNFCDRNFTSNLRRTEETTLTWNEKSECYSYEFDDMITSMKQIDWLTAWIYQTCTEFSYFQTGSSDKQPFTKNIPIELYYDMCSKLFGSEFDETRVKRGVEESNNFYGGLKPNVTHVVFVNGNMDPWSKLGILEDISYEAPAKTISRASHCRDLFSDRDNDPEELKEARNYIKYLIKRWVGEGEYKKQ